MSHARPLRLAWFSPWPPARSGIADYSVELVPRLRDRHAVDVFVEGCQPASPRGGNGSPAGPILPAHEFVSRQMKAPYDLVVYQLGNATCHDYMWGYLFHYPGLLVLHDGQVHQARARALLAERREDDYRAEFRFSHPDGPADLAELVVQGRGGSLFYLWPMLAAPIGASRMTAVHGRWLADDLARSFPEARIAAIRMGVADPWAGPADPAVPPAAMLERAAAVRRRYGVPERAVLFAAFGHVTPEKRIAAALRALASAGAPVHLMLVGETRDYYDVRADIARLGLDDRVTVTGYVSDADWPDHLQAADVCLCLRWPTARETSAAWLRCLAAGKPTVITDLLHTCHVAALDPRDWRVRPGDRAGAAGPADQAPVTVAVDTLDEQHSLTLAVRRLAADPDLRASLGAAARRYWRASHTPEMMVEDYERVIAESMTTQPRGQAGLPAHLTRDGGELGRRLSAELGLRLDVLEPGR